MVLETVVVGTASIVSDAYVSQRLSVAGGISFGGLLSVRSAIKPGNTMSVEGSGVLGASASIGALRVAGTLSVSSEVSPSSSASLRGSLDVSGSHLSSQGSFVSD